MLLPAENINIFMLRALLVIHFQGLSALQSGGLAFPISPPRIRHVKKIHQLTISSGVSITLILTATHRPPLFRTSKCTFVLVQTFLGLFKMSLSPKCRFFFDPVTLELFIVPPSSVVLFTKPSCIPAPIKLSQLLLDIDLF